MVYPTISVIDKDPNRKHLQSLFISAKIPSSLSSAMEENGITCSAKVYSGSPFLKKVSSAKDKRGVVDFAKECMTLKTIVVVFSIFTDFLYILLSILLEHGVPAIF